MSGRGRSSSVAHSKEYSLDNKNMMVRIAEKMIEKDNASIKKVHRHLSRIGFPVGESTLRRWRQEYRTRGEATSETVGPGRLRLLDEVEEDILSGYILNESRQSRMVSQSSLATFIREYFEVQCTPHTAGNYARDLGFCFKDLETSTKTNKYSTDELTDMAFEWIKTNRMKRADRSKVCCLDFTFTSHRKLRAQGYQKKGARRSRAPTGVTRFTNCIVMCTFADGVNRAPPMMFTYDQQFKQKPENTERRVDAAAQIKEVLGDVQRELGVTVARQDIVYLDPPETKEGKVYTFVGERQLVLELFMKERRLEKDIVIFHDAGSVFGKGKIKTLNDLGYHNQIVFEPAVHQILSMCDNNWIVAAKAKWVAKFHSDFRDNISSSIWLLAFLRKTHDNSIVRFRENFLVGDKRLEKRAVQEIISGCSDSQEKENAEKLAVFYHFMGLDGYGNIPGEAGDPGLNGKYWTIIKKRRVFETKK